MHLRGAAFTVSEKSKNIKRDETGPDGQTIFGHTDVLMNDIFCERQYLYVLRQ